MSKNTIKINGEKLRSLLEGVTGRTVYQIAKEQGFSKNLIAEAIRTGKASPIVQSVAKIYGITPEAYILKEPEAPKAKAGEQISIDDISTIKRDELKDLIKEALREILIENNVTIRNPHNKTIKIFGSEEV